MRGYAREPGIVQVTPDELGRVHEEEVLPGVFRVIARLDLPQAFADGVGLVESAALGGHGAERGQRSVSGVRLPHRGTNVVFGLFETVETEQRQGLS